MKSFVQLGDLCHVITKGTTPNSSLGGFSQSGINYIKSESLNYNGYIDQTKFAFIQPQTHKALKRSILEENDVLISIAGANLGKVGMVSRSMLPANTNQAVGIIRVNLEKADPKFIQFYLRNPQFVANNLAGVAQSAQPNLNLGDINRFNIPVFSLAEQREIAATLGALDDKIELNRKTAATLEEMVRALYRSWFVDFDPVWAKAEGRTPAHMDGATAALFPDSFEDDGLPEGWKLTSIGEVGEIVGGSTPSTKRAEFWEGGENLWATPKDLSSLRQPVLFQTERQVTNLGLAQISSGLSPEGTLLLSSRAPIGYLAIAQAPVAVNQGFIAIRETEELSGVEAFCWCHENMDAIHANANGSTFQEISKKNFRPLPYLLAPASIRAAFNQQAGAFFARLQSACAENQTLATLRDSLLPKLMSGELRVGEAQEMVEAAE